MKVLKSEVSIRKEEYEHYSKDNSERYLKHLQMDVIHSIAKEAHKHNAISVTQDNSQKHREFDGKITFKAECVVMSTEDFANVLGYLKVSAERGDDLALPTYLRMLSANKV